jgi:hypothetical protein
VQTALNIERGMALLQAADREFGAVDGSN